MAIIRVPALLMLFAALSCAQMQPQSAHVNLFFPHLTDGGPASQKWQTTFTFVNTSLSEATVDLFLLADDGSPLTLDFGNGAASEHHFVIKAGGTRILRSLSSSDNTVVGWAIAYSSVPVMGTVAFRYFENGAPRQEMSAQPTLPTITYFSAADGRLGIALANVNPNDPVNVAIDLLDPEGQYWGERATVSVPPLGHRAFNLADLAPFIGRLGEFSGSVMLSALGGPRDEFLAWTVASDAQGIFSTLPPGAIAFPISHWDRIEFVFQEMLDAGEALGILNTDRDWGIGLEIVTEDRVVNAFVRDKKTVGVSLGLSQLISDSAGELAFVVAHELAHVYQQQTGKRDMNSNDAENDADLWATVMMLWGGYDPYSISGALAKIQLALRAKMADGFDNLDNAAALQSVKAQLDGAFDTLQTACLAKTEYTAQCDYYKTMIHPDLPADWKIAPLRVRPRPAVLQRQGPRPVAPRLVRPRTALR